MGFSKWLQKQDTTRSQKGQYEAVPLNDVGEPHASRQPSPIRNDVEQPTSLRRLRVYFVLLVISLCLRLELFREILRNVQCSGTSWELLLLISIAAWDYWTVRRRKRLPEFDDEGASVYETLEHSIARTPFSFLAVSILFSVGASLALASISSPRSTFICAAGYPYRWVVPLLQHWGSLLDVLIIFCITQLLTLQDGRGSHRLTTRFASIGYAFLVCASHYLLRVVTD